MGKDTNPVWVQGTHAYRNDDGDLSGATWKGGEEGLFHLPENVVFRLRILLGESANQTLATTYAPQLQFKRNGGSWTTVGSATDLQYAASADTSWTLTDGDTESTDRLTQATGVANRYGTNYYDENNSTTGIALADQSMEIEYCLKVKSGLTGGNSAYSISDSGYLGMSFATGIAAPEEILVVENGATILVLDATDLYKFEGQPGYPASYVQTDVLALDVDGLNITSAATSMVAKSDGKEMFILTSGGTLFRISMSTAWDIGNATDPSDSVDLSTALTNEGGGSPRGLDIKPDGTVVIISDIGSDKVHQFSGTTWDASTFTTDNLQVDVSGNSSNPECVRYNGDGTKIFVNDLASDDVYQYSIASAYSFNGTNSYDSVSLSVTSEEGNMTGMSFDENGDYLYIIGQSNDSVYIYNSGAEHFQLRLNDSTEGVCDTILSTPHIKVEAVYTDTVPVIKSSSTQYGSSASSLVITAPSGITDDDLLMIFVSSDFGGSGNVTYTPPTGFTDAGPGYVRDNDGGAGSAGRWYKKIASSESGNYTVSISPAATSQAIMLRIDGADTTTPISAYSFAKAEDYSVTIDVPSPSVTPGSADNLIVCLGGWDTSSSLQSFPVSTRLQNHNDQSGIDGFAVYREWPIASETGVFHTDTGSSGLSFVAATFAIQPPQGASFTGTSSWTEEDDTSSASGTLEFSGTSSWTEDDDTCSSSGTVTNPITGTSTWTEEDDTCSASGTLEFSGTSAWTEDDDTCSSSGTLEFSGTSTWTEEDDTSSASGTLEFSGTSAWTEDDDTCSASGTVLVPITGTSSWTEDDDTSSASGTLTFSGTSAWTEDDDTSSASGILEFSGTSSWTEDDDTCSSSGTLEFSGTSSWTEENDTCAASGTVFQNITGTSSWTEDDDTCSSSGTLNFTGTSSWTEDDDTTNASGTETFSGTSSWTEDDDTCAASGALTFSGTSAWTEDNDTSTGSGSLELSGNSSWTEEDDTSSASGVVTQNITGTSAWTENDDGCSASGELGITIPTTRPPKHFGGSGRFRTRPKKEIEEYEEIEEFIDFRKIQDEEILLLLIS